METIQQRFEVERPVGAVYDAIAQPQSVLESLPGVSNVRREGADTYRITLASPDAREVELHFTAKLPPRRIEWRTGDGAWMGAFDFEPIAPERTAIAISAQRAAEATADSASAAAIHDAIHALKQSLQTPYARSLGGRLAGSSRRYASEWRDTAQAAFTRPTEFPFRMMRTLTRQMDRLWTDVWRSTPVARLPQMMPGMPWNPDVEVCEETDQVRVCIDVPGVDERHLQVEIDEGSLTVRGERQDERARDGGQRRSELHYGTFSRRIPLPDGVDPDAARAVLRNGVLEVRIPLHRREPRRVPVQHAG